MNQKDGMGCNHLCKTCQSIDFWIYQWELTKKPLQIPFESESGLFGKYSQIDYNECKYVG